MSSQSAPLCLGSQAEDKTSMLTKSTEAEGTAPALL